MGDPSGDCQRVAASPRHLMQLSATYTFDTNRDAVWALLTDPSTIAECLPGCDELKPLGDDRYKAVLTIGVAAITGRYEATVAMVDQDAPSSYRLLVDGTGKAGFAKGEATVTLSEDGPRTVVGVEGHAQVGGTVARVGQRLLGSVSKMMVDRFFGCLAKRSVAP